MHILCINAAYNNILCIIFGFSLYCEGLLCIKYCLHILESTSLSLIKFIFTWGKWDAGFRGVHILRLELNKWSVNTDRVKQELSQGCLFPQPRLCSGVCVRVCVWEYYSATKKKEVLPFERTWVDLEGVMLSEMSDREEQRLHYLIYIWNLNTKSKQTHRKRDQDCGRQRQRWRGNGWGGQKVKTLWIQIFFPTRCILYQLSRSELWRGSLS